MTLVGKILVVFIMVFALFFLALSTVVFTTAENWKEVAQTRQEAVSKAETTIKNTQQELDERQRQLADVQAQHEQAVKALQDQIKNLQDQNEVRQREISESRVAVQTSLQSAEQAQSEAQARIEETQVLRKTLDEVQVQANKYKTQQIELLDQIRLLRQQLGVVQQQAQQLQEDRNILQSELRRRGLPDDPSRLVATANVPPAGLEGVVTAVGAGNSRIRLSIGTDDGVKVGQEYELYRFDPRPEWLGRVRVVSTSNDSAVAEVIGGKTNHGKEIREGDRVSGKIQSRSS